MDVSLGLYKNPLDMDNKYKAYMKLLTASSNIQRMNTEAFQRKKELGDVIPRDLDEMPLYQNEQERQLDTIAQKNKARMNLRDILKNEKDVREAMGLLDKQPRRDPFDGSQLPSPYALFNLYFGVLKERVKNLAGLRPAVLIKYYTRVLDEKEEDLLPNALTISEIKGQLDLLEQQGARGEELRKQLRTKSISETDLNKINETLQGGGSPQERVDRAVRVATKTTTSAPSPKKGTIAGEIVKAYRLTLQDNPSFQEGSPARAGGVVIDPLYPTKEDYESRRLQTPRLDVLKRYNQAIELPVAPRRQRIEEEEEKTPLTEGTGVRPRGRPRRIVGGGIEVPQREADWYFCGIFRISKNLLHDNQLSVYYAKSLGRPNIHKLKRTINISDKLRDFLLHLLKRKEMHLPSFYKLSKGEQSLVMDLMKGGKCREMLEESFGGEIPSIQTDELETAIHRFGLIKGQIEAGNNHPDLLKELTEHIDTMHQYGQLSNNDRVKIYKTLLRI